MRHANQIGESVRRGSVACLLVLTAVFSSSVLPAAEKPNVLFIAVASSHLLTPDSSLAGSDELSYRMESSSLLR